MLRMDELLRHFETMGSQCLLVFTGESSETRVCERWCEMDFVRPLYVKGNFMILASDATFSTGHSFLPTRRMGGSVLCPPPRSPCRFISHNAPPPPSAWGLLLTQNLNILFSYPWLKMVSGWTPLWLVFTETFAELLLGWIFRLSLLGKSSGFPLNPQEVKLFAEGSLQPSLWAKSPALHPIRG